MKVIRNGVLPVGRRFAAINIFGVLFARHGVRITPELINHERIHTAQMRELLFVFFYPVYVLEWLWRLICCRGNWYKAYNSISFEREAYRHDGDLSYLARRRHFAQWRRH